MFGDDGVRQKNNPNLQTLHLSRQGTKKHIVKASVFYRLLRQYSINAPQKEHSVRIKQDKAWGEKD